MVALASAFVRLRPQVDKADFRRQGEAMGKEAGDAAGKAMGDGIARESGARLRNAKGQFVKAGEDAGTASGKAYADGFYRDANGRLRQANGRFATDAQKAAIEGGGKAGSGFADSFGKKAEGIRDKLRANLKLAAGVFVPLGIAGAVGEIAKIGITYENNLNIMQAVTKATGAQMDQVAAKARALGADVSLPGVSAAGAADAMTQLAKAGFTVQQSMDAARGTLQLARIAHIDEGKAADIAAAAVNAFGIKASDVDSVVDQLAATANSSAVEISDVSDAFKMAASVFSGFQGPAVGSKEAITELNTAIAILGNNGIKGSDAGTSLKQMMLQLTGPTKVASNVMDGLAAAAFNAAGTSKEFFMEMKDGHGHIVKVDQGMTLLNAVLTGTKKQQDDALQQLYELNPQLQNMGGLAFDNAGKMRSLSDILGILAKGTANLTQEEKAQAITTVFGADASRSVLALMKGGLPVYEAQRKAVLQQGAAATVAAAQNKGLGGAIDNVKGQVENAAISIYNGVKGPLTSALNGLANVLAPLASSIANFFGFMSRHAGTVRVVAVAIGILTTAFVEYKAVMILTTAVTRVWAATMFAINFVRLASSLRSVTAAMAALDIAMDANPIGLVVVAITALVAGLIYAYKHSERFRAIVDATWAGIKTAVLAVVNWFKGTALPVLVAVWQGIAAGATWLWKNIFVPVWRGISAVVSTAIAIVRGIINGAVAAFQFIGKIVTWLYVNIFAPVFAAIRKVVEIWWFAVRIIFAAVGIFIRTVLAPVFQFWRGVAIAVFSAVRSYIASWWAAVRVIFALVRQYLIGPLVQGFTYVRSVISNWASAIRGLITSVWAAVKVPLTAFYNMVRNTLVNGFATAVRLIGQWWEKVKELARKPIVFVVDHVVNPFIGGLNAAAKVVGIKDRLSPIRLAEGGEVPRGDRRRRVLGYAGGGRIAGTPAMTDNRQAMISGIGPVQLMGGEFVVNAKDTLRALPLLRWINSGMKGGPADVTRRIGRPLTDMPGDGSEGWAFAKGGLIGFVKDVWGAISNPLAAIRKPFDAALSGIPGAGLVKNFVIGAAKKIFHGAIDWLTGFGGGTSVPLTGSLGAAAHFLRAQAGKPYIWASAGPNGYDCSGIVSAVYNILKGRSPYSHTFSTEQLPGPWFHEGQRTGPLIAGWSHPGQSPASNSTGHMAGQLLGLPFESRGSRGVVLGDQARAVGMFRHLGAARLAAGGLVPRVHLFDNGGAWPSGTFGANFSGQTEYVSKRPPGSGDVHIHVHAQVIGSQDELDRWLAAGITRLKRQRKIT